MANVALMYEVLDFIEANPKEWNQSGWKRCFAGITCRLSGYDIVDLGCFCGNCASALSPQGKHIDIPDAAMDLLDIDFDNEDEDYPELFESGNSLADLRKLVASYGPRPTGEDDIDRGLRKLLTKAKQLVSA